MISGTGVDMVELGRFEKLIGRHRALGHLFGAEEAELLRRRGSLASYAVNFCAKEAFAKALGTGVRGFRLYEVQLLRDDFDRPYFMLAGAAREIADKEGLIFHISATHTRELVTAFVVAERTDCH